MFELRKSFTFEASHQLEKHDGKCAKLHGHSYTLTVELKSPYVISTGPKRNMVTDFQEVSQSVKTLINSHLDHRHLNSSLETESPTAEYIAYWVYYQLLPALPHLSAVQIQETSSSSATYRPHRCLNLPCVAQERANELSAAAQTRAAEEVATAQMPGPLYKEDATPQCSCYCCHCRRCVANVQKSPFQSMYRHRTRSTSDEEGGARAQALETQQEEDEDPISDNTSEP